MQATVQDSISTEPPSRFRWANVLAGGVIVLAAIAAYHNSLRIPFLFDDAGSITNNQSIRSLWPVWPVLKPLPGGLPSSGRPVVNLSFALNYAVSGLNVWSYHVFNLVIHILAGLTLFGIVRRTLLRWSALSPTRCPAPSYKRLGDKPLHLAFVIALIWTVHPLQTEAVVYISQRAESLMGLFYLLTLYLFIRGADADLKVGRIAPNTPVALRKTEDADQLPNGAYWGQSAPPRRFLLLSVLACLLGMATKEVMVSAPLIVLLYDRTFIAGSFREAWRLRREYYLGLASTWLVLIWLVLGTGTRGGTAGFGLGFSSWGYALIQFRAIAHYLRLAVWPHPLVFYYDRPVGAAVAATAIDAAIVIFLIGWSALSLTRLRPAESNSALGTTSVFAMLRRDKRSTPSYSGQALGFAGAWFFAILAPSSSIVPVATETMAEHRMYLSLAAVIAGAAGGIYFLAGRLGLRRDARFWFLPCLLIAAGLGFMTERRNRDYRSDLALWTDTVAKTPESSFSRNNLGNALLQLGDVSAAIAQCTEALRLNPRNAKAHSDLADALAKMGRRTEAISHYDEALRITPDDADTHNNLGIALAGEGRLPEAIAHYKIALRLNPDLAVTHNNLGNAWVGLQKFPEAIAEYKQALQLQPDYAGADDNLGAALAAANRLPEAIAAYQRALQLKADFPEAENHLGNALRAMGRMAEAGSQYKKAVQLRPGFPEARNNLGNVLLASGKKVEAIAQYREALRLDPGNFEAHCNLGEVLADLGRMEEAAGQFAAASRLQPNNAEIHNDLGCVLGELGRTAEASAEFEAALRIDPNDAEARTNLELLRNPAKRPELAPADVPR